MSHRMRMLVAARYLYLTAVLVATIGAAGFFISWPLLTSTIGPTAYVFAAHPRSEAARLRNAALGHGVAVAVGLGCLAAFGLWGHTSVVTSGRPDPAQVAASAAAVGTTLFLLELLHSHHAPAAATALLITTGLASPGAPLGGLVLGLVILCLLGPLCSVAPLARDAAVRDQLASTQRAAGSVSDRP